MNALHDRAVLRSKSKAFFGGGTFVMQYRVRIILCGQACAAGASRSLQDGGHVKVQPGWIGMIQTHPVAEARPIQIASALRASGDHRQVGVREVIKRGVGKRIGMGWAEANHACNVLRGWSWSIEF